MADCANFCGLLRKAELYIHIMMFFSEGESSLEKIDKDADTGFVSNGAHYIRFVGVKPEFLWFESTCTDAHSDVIAELADAAETVKLENITKCQDPIENMEVEMIPSDTIQRPEWLPDIYMKNDEKLEVKITTTKGLPIQFNISYDGTLINDEFIEDEGIQSNYFFAFFLLVNFFAILIEI